MKVLIVDDRAENQLLLREQLRGLYADAVTADSGVRALREMRAHKFDLVVTDLLMPEMDGFQLCYLLKTDPVLKRTPVVIYTANYATRKDEEQAKSLGADDFITRPIDEEILTDRIRLVMARAGTGLIAEPHAKPAEGFFREYSSLLIEKLEDQLITAEENARLRKNLEARNHELKRSNEELTQLNQDLESYSYSVSHDLRAPVRAIASMAEALIQELDPLLSPDAKKLVERIRFNTDRMQALIAGLLEHYRMRDVGKALRPVELDDVVKAALAGLDFTSHLEHGAIVVDHPLPSVVAHEQALVQVITNLIENALKFVAPGKPPRVHVSADRVGERVRVKIDDNGIGIAAEHRHRLFNIFERIDPSDKYPGTGVGLAIVRRGIERMGGTIGVESIIGSGSSFWFELASGSKERVTPSAPSYSA